MNGMQRGKGIHRAGATGVETHLSLAERKSLMLYNQRQFFYTENK